MRLALPQWFLTQGGFAWLGHLAMPGYMYGSPNQEGALKCETVLGTLDATPKVPRHTRLTQGEHRGSRHHFI